jgi:hypothetical protein
MDKWTALRDELKKLIGETSSIKFWDKSFLQSDSEDAYKNVLTIMDRIEKEEK